jgi:uroporphyrinogen-III synthase|tara:strand:- start:30 stop:233 length:204 start_codon:yes stop_codon:yes gene_type:complete
MKTLTILSLLILLTNCAGGNVAKIKFGKKCTVANSKQLQEASYVWFVSKEALHNFDKRINKTNCLKT